MRACDIEIATHIGGTMSPGQNLHDGFSPYDVVFEYDFGGYNFGCTATAGSTSRP